MTVAVDADAQQLSRGPYWQQLSVGQKFKTWRRTITETDLVNFFSCTGMLETTFIDASNEGVMSGRPVPAALTYGIIEGFQFQSLIQGVGLALLDMSMKALAPVRVGDTIRAVIEVRDIRPTTRNNRAIVKSAISIFNQLDEPVLTYDVTRLVAGDPALPG